ncbi:MAG: hypothetical protein J6A46_03930, partial [Clostridia bacterium]|nr:hypothetical protein [Clostridia bacterium]
KNGGERYFFDKAFTEQNSESDRLYNSLKEEIALDKVSIEDEERVKSFFEEIAKEIKTKSLLDTYEDEYDFSQIEKICFGYPAYIGEKATKKYCSLLKEVLRECFQPIGENEKKDSCVEACPEPILGANAYLYAHKDDQKIKEGDMVLVLDFGGHTFDIALVKAVIVNKELQFVQAQNCVSLKPEEEYLYKNVFVGKFITMDLCRKIYGEDAPFDHGVDEKKRELFADDWNTGKRVCGTTKFLVNGGPKKYQLQYSVKEGDNGIVGFVGDLPASIKMEKRFKDAVGLIDYYLSVYGNVKISHVLFTGGTSRIKPLRKNIINGIKHWLAEDSENGELLMDGTEKEVLCFPTVTEQYALSSDNAVALGAALVAAGRCKPLSKVKAKEETTLENEKKKNQRLELKNKDLERKLFLERCKSKGLSNEMLMKAIDEQKDIWLKAIDLLGKDKKIWENLTSNEKEFLKKILNKTIDLD